MSLSDGVLENAVQDQENEDWNESINGWISDNEIDRKLRRGQKKVHRLLKKLKKKKKLSKKDKKKLQKCKRKVSRLKKSRRKMKMQYLLDGQRISEQRMKEQMELLFYRYLFQRNSLPKKSRMQTPDVIDVPWKEIQE